MIIMIGNYIGYNNYGDPPLGEKDLITQIGIEMVTENGTGSPNEDIIAE
tara:strand:+ start:127 stop:273 length:147 start_codon:yes stop_codon:yes gene_type:complete